jgi:hypothetical protein
MTQNYLPQILDKNPNSMEAYVREITESHRRQIERKYFKPGTGSARVPTNFELREAKEEMREVFNNYVQLATRYYQMQVPVYVLRGWRGMIKQAPLRIRGRCYFKMRVRERIRDRILRRSRRSDYRK